MIATLLLLALVGFTLYVGFTVVHDHLRKRKQERERLRLRQHMASEGGGSAGGAAGRRATRRPGWDGSTGGADPDGLAGAPGAPEERSGGGGPGEPNAGQDATTRRFQTGDGSWVEVTKQRGSFPFGSFTITHSTKSYDVEGGALLDTIRGGGGRQFPIVLPAALPTFSDVGGMEDFKQEVRDTLGLILRHGQGARSYGIEWNGVLLHGPPGVGKTFLARAVAGEYGLNLLHVSTGDLVEGIVGQSARNVQRAFEAASEHRPCLLFFDEFDSIAQRRDGGSHAEERRTVNQLLTNLEASRGTHDLVIMAATNDLEHLDPAAIRPGRFDRHVRIDLPDRDARRAVLEAHLRQRPSCGKIDLDELARRTRGMTPAALARVVDAAALRAFRDAASMGEEVEIAMEHLLAALEAHGGQDRPTVEDWDWDHLVLPPDVKAELQQLQALLEDPQLAESFGVEAPSGVLLAGPPGTGKTTVARVLAAQARCSFYPVSAADVMSKWVGEAEGNVRRLFERARTNRPSIIFIDELDAIAARRGSGSDGVERALNQLLVEIDGLGSSAGILVIGATNRPELLDPALLRGGRLSRTVRLDLPEADAREAILRMNTERMPTVDVDLTRLATATDGLSGADLKALCQQAAVYALVRSREEEGPSASDVASAQVLPEDFARALEDRRGMRRDGGS